MLWNTIILALREIRRNVLRSTLTMLGIVIGVAAVIIMVTIGEGTTAQVRQQIASMGSNVLIVTQGRHLGPGQSTARVPFKESDVIAISRDIAGLKAVAPVSSNYLQAIYGNENWSTQIIGSNNQYFTASNRVLKAGRQFREGELRGGAAVCVVGATIVQKLFGNQDPVGAKLRLQKFSCEVIGVLAEKGQSSMGTDQDDIIIIPLATFQRRIAGNQDVSSIQISAQEGAATEKIQQEIQALLRERRHLSPSENDNFDVRDMKEIANMLTSTTRLLTTLLSAVAAVSLLVGGIGIMNIMLVSVTERTREIGIRLAIGAFEREVLMQFLVEAVALSSLGGLIGVVLALVVSLWLASALQVPFVFNAFIILIAFLFSAAVGVIFGYFPALKAARLDPIDALRHE